MSGSGSGSGSVSVSVEDVSSSLVREYLSRKGLKRTITCMDEEHPRTEASINNRSQLRQVLNIEALYRKNKVENSPLKTLLEIIVKHHISGLRSSDPLQPVDVSADAAAATPVVMNDTRTDDTTAAFAISKQAKSNDQTGFWANEDQESRPQPDSLEENDSSIRREEEKNTQRSRPNRMRRGMMAGPIASTSQESNKKRQTRRLEVPLLRKEDENRLLVTEICSTSCVNGRQEIRREKIFEKMSQDKVKTNRAKCGTRTEEADSHVPTMVLDDVDDDEVLQELSKVSLPQTITEPSSVGRPMNQQTAMELKAVLLGSSRNIFSVEWKNQGFTFSENHDLRYGIVQKKGGPCGVLASIQAFVLKNLLFENIRNSDTDLQSLRPSNTSRRKCLVSAAAEVLWRAGQEKQATVAINSGRNHFTPTGQYKSEGVLEKMLCFTVDNIRDLQLLVEQHIEQFEAGALGCMLLTISAVLSRSIDRVREDMDVPTTSLIGAHGYCTQELVNLLLCGRAVSNVFDNVMELDSGNGNLTLLKGITEQCDVGLLSLFEHYNICKVGAFLKTPRYPVWVVCSESHFSVLFGLQRELLAGPDQGSDFDLYYYDGLANQQEEIRLTVSVGKLAASCQDVDTDLIPPLEQCIRTRWKDAFVNWNDTEPIL